MYILLTNPDLTRGWESGSSPLQSLGGYLSNLELIDAPELLTDVFTPDTDYRCIGLDTEGTDGKCSNIVVTVTGPGLTIAQDPTPSQTWNSETEQAVSTTSPTETPSGVSGWATEVDIPSVSSASAAIWVRREPTSAGDKSGSLTFAWDDDRVERQTRTFDYTWTEPETVPELPPATGDAVRNLWIGPLGAMVEMEQAATWSRPRELGAEEFVSLTGRVTTSRARWATRRMSLQWERLTPETADALGELALVSRFSDSTVDVVDPEVRNLVTPEQSRGRPLLGGAEDEQLHDLYRVDGSGTAAVGFINGERYACTRDAVSGDVLMWLHPYHADRGWPVVPGWPVYMTLGSTGAAWIGASVVPQLVFYDAAGAAVGKAEAGSTHWWYVSADAPANAVTVSPRAVFTENLSGLSTIGPLTLAHYPLSTDAPASLYTPLGRGSTSYAITAYSDDPPFLPLSDVTVDLVEVTSSATR